MKKIKEPGHIDSIQYRLSGDEGDITLYLSGGLDTQNAALFLNEIEKKLKAGRPGAITLDLSGLTYVDDYGVMVFSRIRDMLLRREAFRIINAGERVSAFISMIDLDSIEDIVSTREKRLNPFVNLGEEALKLAYDFRFMLSFLGEVFLALLHVIRRPGTLRAGDTLQYMQRAGVEALPIVALINFLLGLIIAFMSSIQLRQFGADIYVASLVGLAMTYELSPVMTCILVAGRSGSSFASEIGTMKVSEEIDALFTMGFDPVKFLVTPRLLASLIVVPILTLFADLFAIMGGLFVGIFVLDLTANAYISQTFRSLTPFYVFYGVLKGCVFAVVIAWVGCMRGFQVRGGADSVGKATTSAVVTSIFMIIILDAVFAIIHIYWL
ncbi:MAG: MlaE family lipid ABC transporter permease subunit [Deltaproteobacteria bacterium]|jgi:phospholipid/cholesterol/gamma-HCH transport system permease protein|nr:MlaE family lipid ABC transporter permease subunit [Deltaproteobacteria bacterium]